MELFAFGIKSKYKPLQKQTFNNNNQYYDGLKYCVVMLKEILSFKKIIF
jgi:hypothetical protein